MPKFRFRIPISPLLGLLLSACAVTPPLWHATNNFPFSESIPIHDVVQRVKCDISKAFFGKLYVDENRDKLKWMQNWTAKADLTFEANESGGITPNLAFVQPLKNAFFLGAGPNSVNTATGAVTNVVSATSQNFTFGIGGTFSGQVTRTETLSFTVSFAELRDWEQERRIRARHGEDLTGAKSCSPSAPTDLQGGLDLKPWLDEVLKPAQAEELEAGLHPDPGAVKPSTNPSRSAAPPKPSGAMISFLEKPFEAPKPPELLTTAEKLSDDLEFATGLAELGIVYDLTKYKDFKLGDRNICATVYSPDGKALYTVAPPPSPSANSSLQQQSITSAQSAIYSSQQASVSPTLSTKIVKKIKEIAKITREQAVQVQVASVLAAESLAEQCEAQGNTYLKNGTKDCSSYQKNAGLDDPTKPKVYAPIQLSPAFCDANAYRQYLSDLRTKQIGPAEQFANAVQQNSALASRYLTPDPPIESIGQSINFVVTLGVNDSPNWMLLRLKGPTNGGSFASLSGIRTHTLNIAMGPPTQSGAAEVSRVLSNQAFRQAIQGIQGVQP